MSVYGLVSSPMVIRKRRLTVLPTKRDNLEAGVCALQSCEAPLHFLPSVSPGESLIEVACTMEHALAAGWFPKEHLQVSSGTGVVVKTKPVESCPICGGDRKFKSNKFFHKDDCADSPENVAKAKKAARGVCPHCGGPPAFRRGFVHTEECTRGKPVVEKVVRPSCPHCSGPARGKGWTHKDDCSRPRPVVKVREVKEKVVRPSCSECGGPASGRGWAHEKGCSKRSVYKPTGVGRGRGRRRRRRRPVC